MTNHVFCAKPSGLVQDQVEILLIDGRLPNSTLVIQHEAHPRVLVSP
jgi:hypothetical protein